MNLFEGKLEACGHTSFTSLPRSTKFNTDIDINTRHNTNRKTKYKMFH